MTIRRQPSVNRTIIAVLLLAAASLFIVTSSRAAVIDLTTGPDASGEANGAFFFATEQQPAGSGFIDPFLRAQESGNGGFVQGYNTDGGFPFDDKNPHNFQHSLALSSLMQFDLNGIDYFKFLLDSNVTGAQAHQFTLTQLQIFTTNDPAQTVTTFDSNGVLQLNGTLAYNLNSPSQNSVITTATGSGKYDAVMYVPVSDFTLADKYVVLYFAGQGNGGFEEWTAATSVAAVPEASSFFPIVGLLGAVFSSQFIRRPQLQHISKS